MVKSLVVLGSSFGSALGEGHERSSRWPVVLRALRRWRRHAAMIIQDEPADIWRELCWWYLVYPGRDGTGDWDVVFAVEVRPRRPAIHAAVLPRPGESAPEGQPGPPLAAPARGLSQAF
jgi:hypothetical protein